MTILFVFLTHFYQVLVNVVPTGKKKWNKCPDRKMGKKLAFSLT